MTFNSFQFLVFFPIVVLMFFVIPEWKMLRRVWLLFASIFFYMCWNIKYVVLLVFCILVTYIGGLLLQKYRDEKTKKRIVLCIILLSVFFVLFFFKYANFALDLIQRSLSILGVSINQTGISVLLPMGISFFTFQSAAYLIDVYRGDLEAERNLIDYALFISFFPQLVAGPIERSKNLLPQLKETHGFDPDRVKHGLELMLWGYFEKLVIADRIAIYVNTVFDHYENYAFFEIALAAIGFAIQIYCDFGGYSHIAIGAAEVLGIHLMQNFRQPYFATSVKDFWSRWHISLSTWFKDYLYIPMGGGRRGFIRKNLNILIVFAVSGLWHGAAMHFVIWGALHGIYQVIENICKYCRDKLKKKCLIRKTDMINLLSMLFVFLIVTFAWIFFRAPNLHSAFAIIKQMGASMNPWVIFDGSLLKCGLDRANVLILLLAVVVLVLVDILHERGRSIRAWIDRQNVIFRFGIYYLGVMIVLFFGVYGVQYDAAKFLYFAF